MSVTCYPNAAKEGGFPQIQKTFIVNNGKLIWATEQMILSKGLFYKIEKTSNYDRLSNCLLFNKPFYLLLKTSMKAFDNIEVTEQDVTSSWQYMSQILATSLRLLYTDCKSL